MLELVEEATPDFTQYSHIQDISFKNLQDELVTFAERENEAEVKDEFIRKREKLLLQLQRKMRRLN